MIGQPLQGYTQADGDYRHAKLMAEAAQSLVIRPPRSPWIHDLLSKSRRHLASTRRVNRCE